jgi:hypothetical protein
MGLLVVAATIEIVVPAVRAFTAAGRRAKAARARPTSTNLRIASPFGRR